MVQGWHGEAEVSEGHRGGVTCGGSLLCLLRGNQHLAMTPDPMDVARAVLASIPQVYAVWYVWCCPTQASREGIKWFTTHMWNMIELPIIAAYV